MIKNKLIAEGKLLELKLIILEVNLRIICKLKYSLHKHIILNSLRNLQKFLRKTIYFQIRRKTRKLYKVLTIIFLFNKVLRMHNTNCKTTK
jgi:hypothetical protein